jgi:hypothetical protein
MPAAYSEGAQELCEDVAVVVADAGVDRRVGADRVARTMPTVIINPASYAVSACSFRDDDQPLTICAREYRLPATKYEVSMLTQRPPLRNMMWTVMGICEPQYWLSKVSPSKSPSDRRRSCSLRHKLIHRVDELSGSHKLMPRYRAT